MKLPSFLNREQLENRVWDNIVRTQGPELLAAETKQRADQRLATGRAFAKADAEFVKKRDAMYVQLGEVEERTKKARAEFQKIEAEEIRIRGQFSDVHDAHATLRDATERDLAALAPQECEGLIVQLQERIADAPNFYSLTETKSGTVDNRAKIDPYIKRLFDLLDEAMRVRRQHREDVQAEVNKLRQAADDALAAVRG